jgi:nuclear pore complex protein Nup155
VVADPWRNCLYTLSSTNTISLYQPNVAKSVQHIQSLSSLYKLVQEKVPGNPSITPQTFHIISIHVVSPLESRSGVQLVAVTTNGTRLFFASASVGYTYGYTGNASASIRPIQLVHVRLPPPNLLHPDDQEKAFRPPPSIAYGSAQLPQSSSSGPYVLTAIDVAAYSNGLTIACQPGERDSTDFVLCMSPDLTRTGTLGQSQIPSQQIAYNPSNYNSVIGTTRPPLTEYATLLEIPGRAFAAAPVARTSVLSSIAGNAAPAPTVMNELATQWSESPPELMILTNIGLSFLTKRRALDHLKAVLEDFQTSGKVHPVLEFRDSFGRDQTCAMLLALASGNTFLEPDAAFKSGALQTLSPDLATVAKQAFYDFGERPMWAERANFGTSSLPLRSDVDLEC